MRDDDPCMDDPVRIQEALREYHVAYARANAAAIGTGDFARAMVEVRGLSEELLAAGINPATTSSASTKRRLGVVVRAHRPGEHERARVRDQRI
jgi:hypothetical protein